MKHSSVWQCDLESKVLPLEEDLAVDVLIIGAGLAGLSVALELLSSDKKVAVIEKKRVGEGITALSTGKLDFMQGLVYHKIISVRDFSCARRYHEAQKEAIALARKNVEKYHIDCDWMDTSGYVFTNDEKEIPTFQSEIAFYKKMHIPYEEITSLPNGYPCLYGIKTFQSAVFHPVKYLLGLKKIVGEKYPIYEKTCATEIKRSYGKYKVTTNQGVIWAKKVVVCTHYPFFIVPAYIPFKTHIEKSYLLAGNVEKSYAMHAIINKSPVTSFRYHKEDTLVMAMHSHTTTSKDNDEKYFRDLKMNFQKNFAGKITHMWSNHDIMTSDFIPYIGEVEDNLFLVTGFNKWGMTNGILSGKVISDLLLNKENKYSSLFSFHRNISFQKVMNTVVSNVQTGKTFIEMKLDKNKKYYKNVVIKKENGKSIGIYYDGKKQHKVYNTCPHMGCSLLFNSEDKTWDCPCHGSRFTINGEVINGPSVRSIQIK